MKPLKPFDQMTDKELARFIAGYYDPDYSGGDSEKDAAYSAAIKEQHERLVYLTWCKLNHQDDTK